MAHIKVSSAKRYWHLNASCFFWEFIRCCGNNPVCKKHFVDVSIVGNPRAAGMELHFLDQISLSAGEI